MHWAIVTSQVCNEAINDWPTQLVPFADVVVRSSSVFERRRRYAAKCDVRRQVIEVVNEPLHDPPLAPANTPPGQPSSE
jgi:hypothetical protein